MINIKTEKEIQAMIEGGKILSETLWEVLENAKPGISEIELDKLAEDLIVKKGGEPGFKKVKGYSHTICISTNDIVVHGIPTKNKLKEGDVVGIDCGVFYKGFHTDMSETIRIGDSKLRIKNNKIDKFLETGKKALDEAIRVAVLGNRVGDISKAIQAVVTGEGYSIVRNFVGHGVGKDLHEEPEIPGFLVGSIKNTPLLKNGMVIAVEVIYNMGKGGVVIDHDGWTIRTEDGSLSGLFERTVAIIPNGILILTK